jgi:uncharacterized protein YcbK (DUF882 family)
MRIRRKRSQQAHPRALHPFYRRLAAVLLAGTTSVAALQTAAAGGETRSLTIYHTRTNETATVTFRRDGVYDEAALDQLNWLLRDWRLGTPIKMDPRLFDILWEVYRESGSHEPIHIISAYRAPETNAMLRERSSAVSEHSQHMAGKAIDIRLPDVDPARLRAIAMRLQYGGVGYYAASNFVHVDTGSVRAWPRMSLEQLARLFPDGKTVHLPPSGKPLPGYELARAEIAARDQAAGTLAYAGMANGPPLLTVLGKIFGAGTQPAQPTTDATEAAETVEARVEASEPAPVPLPPRRPPADPVQVAAAPPLAGLAPLPAPERPQMAWPAPDDDRAILRALLTAVEGASTGSAAPRIVILRAEPRPGAPSHLVGPFEPGTSLAASFSKPAGGADGLRTGSTPRPIPVNEARAGL